MVKKGRGDGPHKNLVGIASRTFRGLMSGGWEEESIHAVSTAGSAIWRV
jgi:hypothetical protein